MPKIIGEQANPFCALGVTPHVNDAYLTALGGDWETYYAAKRSAATRKTDRNKRKRLADHGEIRFITAGDRDDVVRTRRCTDRRKAQVLCQARRRQHVRVAGIPRLLPRLATGPRSSRLTHVSRLDVGDDDRGGELRTDVSRPLLLHPRRLRRRRTGAFRAGRDPAHGRDALCHSSTAASCSISPSATSPTSASGATPRSALRLRRAGVVARLAGGDADGGCSRSSSAASSAIRRPGRSSARLRMLTGSLRG